MDVGTGISTKGSLNLQAGNDFNAKVAAVQSKDDLNVTAGGNINITAGRSTANAVDDRKDVGKSGGGNTQITYTHENNAIGSSFSGKNVSLTTGKNANVVSSNVTFDGAVKITATENVKITGSEETVSSLNTYDSKKSGMFGSERKKVYDADTAVLQASATISGGSVDLTSGKDTNVIASNVVADNDVNITAGGNVNITAAEDTSSSTYKKQVKKSGLLSGGGFGFTIGKEKRKDQYDNQNVEQAGSTVGSISGNVNVEAGKDINVSASDVLAGKDINLTGQNVTIESADNTYNTQEKHEYKKTGITVSLGGATLDAVNTVVQPLERAHQVQDDRLSVLYGVKAGTAINDIVNDFSKQQGIIDDLQGQSDLLGQAIVGGNGDLAKELNGLKDATNKNLQDAKDNQLGGKNTINVNISIGSQKSKTESESTTTVAQGSNVKAGGDVNITATEKDIDIKGSNVEGENISLKAKEDINVTASANTNKTEQDSKSSSGSLGVTIGAGGLQGVNAGYSQSKGEIKGNGSSYNESTVTANKDLTFTSGEDTNIKGGMLSGEKVTGNVDGDLNIESKQDSNRYEENNSSSSIGIGIDITGKGQAGVVSAIRTKKYNQKRIVKDFSIKKSLQLFCCRDFSVRY